MSIFNESRILAMCVCVSQGIFEARMKEQKELAKARQWEEDPMANGRVWERI